VCFLWQRLLDLEIAGSNFEDGNFPDDFEAAKN
jgi:hypothetical protein